MRLALITGGVLAAAATIATCGAWAAGQTSSAAGSAPVPARLAEGKAVYDKWCAPCHTDSAGLAGTLALQTKYKGEKPAVLEHRTDLTPEIVNYYVRNGVAWMAPFRKTEVSDAQLAAIGEYLTAPLEDRGIGPARLAEIRAGGTGQ
ncbi:cytochrome c [Altererythrobacter xixiisoli]|uniref:Cytochrome c n=1 Tax=Croceibacterium xixiisoli TaxID=1476466 RepID=A0A6I4U1J3_9SPHN|nr:cytochrome c [Croceibacterium xixiisoli]MXP00729.1 cytochrome c [Croceibacterium xixiisoli]